jgi:anion-transporting  ArsA/GET3 family ATPase
MAELLARSQVVVCCGSGGVGKTTTAAVVAMEAARQGRRAVVVTIDPARRLADALGVDALHNEPAQVAGVGASGGELWATMLDATATFDGLVRRYAGDPEQAERIVANRFYRNIAGALSGTQEYMASEKLYELRADVRFDLVVVDTPPTRAALDFLDAPGRLTRFLDHPVTRLMMMPTRVGLRVVNVATNALLKTISKVVGGQVITDVVAFFQAFEGMEAGFRERATEVMDVLRSPETTYVLVASPRSDTVVEARYFAEQLHASGLTVGAVVVNRMHPRFGGPSARVAERSAAAAREAGNADLAALWHNLAELTAVAAAEERALAPVLALAGEAPVARVPLLDDDVHDLDGLAAIAAHVFPSALLSSPPSSPAGPRG